MDKVARAVGDAGGATVVFDAGDDTSVGRTWEAFSLDSVTSAFEDYDRFGVAGNHDHGTFVRSYLDEHGWTMLDGKTLLGPGGIRLLGVDDPRSSGLGNWRDETGLSFAEVGDRLADVACEAQDLGRRVATIVVHDANLGAAALERGCADLVVGGHTHVQAGPDRVVGENGATGYTYTTGTTGGAAYAFALGSKPRRPAGMSLVTYREGRPVGVQAVTLQTTGVFEVGDFVSLSPRRAARTASAVEEGRQVRRDPPVGLSRLARARTSRPSGRRDVLLSTDAHHRRPPAADRGGRGAPRADPRAGHQGAGAAGARGGGEGRVPRGGVRPARQVGAAEPAVRRGGRRRRPSPTRSTSRSSRRSPPCGRAWPSA